MSVENKPHEENQEAAQTVAIAEPEQKPVPEGGDIQPQQQSSSEDDVDVDRGAPVSDGSKCGDGLRIWFEGLTYEERAASFAFADGAFLAAFLAMVDRTATAAGGPSSRSSSTKASTAAKNSNNSPQQAAAAHVRDDAHAGKYYVYVASLS